MSIRNRIFKSNTWIVLLSLLTLLIIGGIVILVFEDTYVKTLTKRAVLQENAYKVQTLVKGFHLDNENIAKTEIASLSDALSKDGYQLYVTKGNKKIYSNMRHDQFETVEIMNSEVSYSENTRLYVWEDKTIVTRKIMLGTTEYKFIAIHNSDIDTIFRLNRVSFELLILSFIIVGSCSIIVILFISRFYTKRLVNKIMIPIHKLMAGAGRIEEGNLDEPVTYEGDDEFEMVCRAFNRMQESLKSGMEKNASYEKARTDMISGISHDLRTPLTSVKGYIKGVKDGIANTPQKQEQYLDIAYKKACEMDILLQKLFYFSKLQTGNMPLFPVKVNFVKFLEEFIKENEEYYVENNLDVNLFYQTDQQDVMIDVEQMSRVLANIIENSLKYRIREKVRVDIEVTEKDHNEVLTITDDGSGVPGDKLPQLFDQFYRVDEARSSKNKGSGLGLYIAKYIIEQHGGSIYATNRDGLSIQIILPKIVS